MARIFVNYRTDDGDFAAALLDSHLTEVFGPDAVFLAPRSIGPGNDFAEEILARLAECAVVFAVVGRRWLAVDEDTGTRRIDDEDDWVRRELVEAGRLGLPVVPVLLDETARLSADVIPDCLAGLDRLQYVRLRHRHSRADLEQIAAHAHTVMTLDESGLRDYLSALAARVSSVGAWLPYSSLEDGFVHRRVTVHAAPPEHAAEPQLGEVSWHNAVRDLRLGVVLASAGSGKTWLLRHHCLKLCETALAELDGGRAPSEVTVPVFVHARDLAVAWSDEPSMDSIARTALRGTTENAKLRSFVASRLSGAEPNTHVLVDAYDEVFDDSLRDAIDEALGRLSAAARADAGPVVLLTSRPAGFSDPLRPLRGQAERDGTQAAPTYFTLGGLTEGQVRSLWQHWFDLRGDPVPWRRLTPAVAPTSAIRTAVRFPLIAAFCAWVAEEEDVRTNRSGLYSQVVDRFHRLGWKQGSPSPFEALRQDAATRARYRSAFGDLAWHMAAADGTWRDAVELVECESVLGRSLVGVTSPHSHTFQAVRAFGILVPWSCDDAGPVGWIHRSVHHFVVAERMCRASREELVELLDTHAWFHPDWAAVLDFALGLEDDATGTVTEVVRGLCHDGNDGLGWFATVLASSAAGSSAADPDAVATVWRLYRSGFLSAEHLARVLALTPLADPSDLAEMVRASAEEHGFQQQTWEALAWCGEAGIRALSAAVRHRRSTAGAAAALHNVAPDEAVAALRFRVLTADLPVEAADRAVVRELHPADAQDLCAAYRRNPGNIPLATLLGWTGTASGRDELARALESDVAEHRRVAVIGLAASFDTELDLAGFSVLLERALRDPDRGVRVTARSELIEIGLSVPWVANRISEHSDDLYRDRTAPELDDLDAIAARLTAIGPSTATALMMLKTDPALITGPVEDALAALTHRALIGDLEPRLLHQVAEMAGDEFSRLACDALAGGVPMATPNLKRLAWALCHARPTDPRVFGALAACARRLADPRVGDLLGEHGLPVRQKVEQILTRLSELREADRIAVEIWSSALRVELLNLPPLVRNTLRDRCANVTRHVLGLRR
ncbi:NACHT domain-containing protein [Actinokineospora soli]|uniref:NACHT domain-containing protein n=1 Tax=Actinokineospora soli TaxID=1048753 RepID=A0ABW2TGE9_9PSEU